MDERPVVDGTAVSSAELRAEIAALQAGHDEQVAEARTELAESLESLDRGLRALRARVVAKAKIAGGVAAVGAGIVGVAVWRFRSAQ
jgi:hypothetical protein